jgi:hypothetical protein
MFPHLALRVLEVGIQLGQATFWAKERMEWCLIPDAEALQYTTFPVGFDVELADSFGGYRRFGHIDTTVRTLALIHWSQFSIDTNS